VLFFVFVFSNAPIIDYTFHRWPGVCNTVILFNLLFIGPRDPFGYSVPYILICGARAAIFSLLAFCVAETRDSFILGATRRRFHRRSFLFELKKCRRHEDRTRPIRRFTFVCRWVLRALPVCRPNSYFLTISDFTDFGTWTTELCDVGSFSPPFINCVGAVVPFFEAIASSH